MVTTCDRRSNSKSAERQPAVFFQPKGRDMARGGKKIGHNNLYVGEMGEKRPKVRLGAVEVEWYDV